MDKIFVQIPSYRDSELVKTIDDCISKCSDPSRLTFGIAWQHNTKDPFDHELEKYFNDPRFTIKDIPWQDSKGACWARSLIQQMYRGERYTLQIDSHHRFAQDWDTSLIKCLEQAGSPKPIMTGYPRPYYANNDSIALDSRPQLMVIVKFNEDGHIRCIGHDFKEPANKPIRSRFISAGFIFTLGSFCQECPYDPELYFEGEEISLAIRAYTSGWDLYHPHINVVWHDYGTYDRRLHWSDHTPDQVKQYWVELEVVSKRRLKQLLRIEDQGIDLGAYGLGNIRSFEDYENYAGLNFSTRTYHPDVRDWKEPPTTFTDDKYIIFSPFRSGLSNVIMSYELAFSIAHITGRTLVLPPTTFLTHITEGSKEQWPSMWQLFDQYNNEFDTAELDELKNAGNYYSWFVNTNLADCYSPPEIQHNVPMADAGWCIVNDYNSIKDNPDFINFAGSRKIIDLNRPEKYIHLENSLFQHYWYWVYAGDAVQRNLLKNKINKAFRYSQQYYDMVNAAVNIGQYNAVHVRRGDFFIQYGQSLEAINTEDKLLSQIEKLLDPSLPLYIATDETNKEFFNQVAAKYKIFFIDDFFQNLSKLDCAIIEQIICSQALRFEGTIPSTYTKRINIMRGLDGRAAADYTGINEITQHSPEMDNPLPWTITNNLWGWNMSSHPQWTQENVS